MALKDTNPLYAKYSPDWEVMRDTYAGERTIKEKGETYLKATKSMNLDGMSPKQPGRETYEAYKMRARFPDYVREAIEHYIGLMHQKPPTIELPAQMEAMIESVSTEGESIELFLRRINEEQLLQGRVGLLLDLPATPEQGNPIPYIALYNAESIINWDDGQAGEGKTKTNLVVLNESGVVRDADFSWTTLDKYRVLQLIEGVYHVGVFENTNGESADYDISLMASPLIRGTPLQEIPFVFVGTKDLISSPDRPPLLGIAQESLGIYRSEADYRQNLFMQGQDTLVIIGAQQSSTDASEEPNAPLRTGAGSIIYVEMGGDAKYVGVESQGLAEQRSALESDRKRTETKAGQLIDAGSAEKESGLALTTRVSAQTASLNQIALTGASALEKLLKTCAEWMGLNPDDVKITPNLEFADFSMSGRDLVDLMTARTMGAPISKESIHGLLVERGMTKFDFQTETDLIGEEDAANPPPVGTQVGGDPNDEEESDA